MKTITTRTCKPTDDPRRITDLIVGTDDYIYPPMFRAAPDEKYDFFAACLADEGSLFGRQNLTLALEGEEIVGLLVTFRGKTPLCHVPHYAALASAADIEYCNREYFAPLLDEYAEKSDTVYVCNLCVDPAHRGKGIGRRLLEDFLATQTGVVELDVLCDNPSAIHLYEKCGFRILYDEDAFAFDPIPNFKSYRMRRA